MNDNKDKVLRLDFTAAKAEPTAIEQEYINQFGKEFVRDLKAAFRWMKETMRRQAMPQEKVVDRRLKLPCVSYSVYFIDFANEEVYRLTRDNWGGMTIYNEGNSPFLWAFKNSENIPVLLGGMFMYDSRTANWWARELLDNKECPSYIVRDENDPDTQWGD